MCWDIFLNVCCDYLANSFVQCDRSIFFWKVLEGWRVIIYHYILFRDIFHVNGLFCSWFTAAKTIFSKSWNIIESSKIPSKYHLSINSFKNRPYFPSPKNSKQEIFSNHWTLCSMLKKTSLKSTFWIKKKIVFQSPKISKQEIFRLSKNGIPC